MNIIRILAKRITAIQQNMRRSPSVLTDEIDTSRSIDLDRSFQSCINGLRTWICTVAENFSAQLAQLTAVSEIFLRGFRKVEQSVRPAQKFHSREQSCILVNNIDALFHHLDLLEDLLQVLLLSSGSSQLTIENLTDGVIRNHLDLLKFHYLPFILGTMYKRDAREEVVIYQ